MAITEQSIVQALTPPTYTNKTTGKVYVGRLLSLPQWLLFADDQKKLAAKEMTDAELVNYIQRFMRAVFPLPARTTKKAPFKWLELVRETTYQRWIREQFDDPVTHIMNDPELLVTFTNFLGLITSVLFQNQKS